MKNIFHIICYKINYIIKMLNLRIQRLNKAVPLPEYATQGSACVDLSASVETPINLEPSQTILVPTGLRLEIPDNYEAQIRPRSGLALKNQITVLNTPGTIDSDYRGEIKVILINLGKEKFVITPLARIAQMIILPTLKVQWEEVDSIDLKTDRENKGFGSTGT